MVRRALLSAVVLAAALVLQLTIVNRLPLPGAGGSTENRGLWLGGTTTMPTTPSDVKSTYGWTRARAVSEPARFSTLLITPTGTPGTYGRS